MSCNRKVALVDLDNTLVDLQGQMDSDLHEVLGEDIKKISKKTLESVEYLIKNKFNWWAGLQPLPFGMSIVEELRKIGFEIVICSKGPRRVISAWTQKVQWVQMYVPDANIVLTQDKSLIYGRLLVDDWPEYIKPWLEARPRGIVLMPATRFNKKFKHPRVYRMEKYEDLLAIKPLLKKIYARKGGEFCPLKAKAD